MNENPPRHGEGKPEDAEQTPEDRPEEPGAEGGSAGAEDAELPFSPNDADDSPLGDTDQHSSA